LLEVYKEELLKLARMSLDCLISRVYIDSQVDNLTNYRRTWKNQHQPICHSKQQKCLHPTEGFPSHEVEVSKLKLKLELS
jgi:hypothetical protein